MYRPVKRQLMLTDRNQIASVRSAPLAAPRGERAVANGRRSRLVCSSTKRLKSVFFHTNSHIRLRDTAYGFWIGIAFMDPNPRFS